MTQKYPLPRSLQDLLNNINSLQEEEWSGSVSAHTNSVGDAELCLTIYAGRELIIKKTAYKTIDHAVSYEGQIGDAVRILEREVGQMTMIAGLFHLKKVNADGRRFRRQIELENIQQMV